MKARFYLLALLTGLFLIVVFPVSVVLFFLVAAYYLLSYNDKDIIHFDVSDVDVPISDEDTQPLDHHPDFNDLFNDDEFVREQEKLR